MFAENGGSVDFQFSNSQFEFSLISNSSSVRSYFNFRQSILFQFQSVRVFQKDSSKVYSYKQIDRSGVSQKLCKTVSYTHLDVYKRQGGQFVIERMSV